MKTPQALHIQIQTLHRTLQAHYNTIEYHKGGANLIAALFNPQVRRQSLQSVANARREIEYTLLQIRDLQEQYVAALFLECWEDEVDHLSDSLFLTESTKQRQHVYAHMTCPSFCEQSPSF